MTVQFGYLTWDEDKQNAKLLTHQKNNNNNNESDHIILVQCKIILFDSLMVYSIQTLIKVNKF